MMALVIDDTWLVTHRACDNWRRNLAPALPITFTPEPGQMERELTRVLESTELSCSCEHCTLLTNRAHLQFRALAWATAWVLGAIRFANPALAQYQYTYTWIQDVPTLARAFRRVLFSLPTESPADPNVE